MAATTEGGQGGDPVPKCGNQSQGKSVWYRFTAPSAGTLEADTFGSSYDTILSAWTGSCGAFSPTADGCNDDAGGGHQSQVSFTASAGVTYWFMVSAYNSDGGTLDFAVTFTGTGSTATPTLPPPTSTPTRTPTSTQTPSATRTPTAGGPTSTQTNTPINTATATRTNTSAATPTGVPNDQCANATIIASAPYTNTQSTAAATTQGGQGGDPTPACGNQSQDKSVWYRFTAPSAGTLEADSFNSSYDTILSAWTGACGAFSPTADGCNDDAGGGHQSQVSFTASAGVTYWFMVSAYSDDGGTLVFHLTFTAAGTTATPSPSGTATVPSGATFTPTKTPTATVTGMVTKTPTATPTGVPNDQCANVTVIASAPYTNTQSTA
ncbi:MAG TPA: hypothetical protein VN812_02395, partial [Candidatus Acidoferrales bacterium]|nr:hypothetical protein [Candidatus Acidoferrales bacterium]